MPAFLCLCGSLRAFTDTYAVMAGWLAAAAAAAFIYEGGRKREQKREGDGEFSKRHRKCGREARGAQNTESSIDPLLSSTLTSWPRSRAPTAFVRAHACQQLRLNIRTGQRSNCSGMCVFTQYLRRTSTRINLCLKKKTKKQWIYSSQQWTLVACTFFTVAASYR